MIENLIVDNSSLVFILESPFDTEVKKGYPLAGSSGKEIARHLLGIEKTSMGEICFNRTFNLYNLSPFSILNISKFPLEEKAYDSQPLPHNIAILKDLKFKIDKQPKRSGASNAEHWTVPKDITLKKLKVELLNELIENLIKLLTINKNIQIVPCGKFVSVFVRRALEKISSISKGNVHFGFTHPARNQWTRLPVSKLEKLRELIVITAE